MHEFKITKVETQKRKRDRFSIFLNNEFWMGVSSDTMHALKLTEGASLNRDEKDALGEEIQVLEAMQRAYSYLSYRDRSQVEVERKLREVLSRKDELSQEDVERITDEVVERLIAKNFLNDADFATSLLENARARKYSRRRASQFLYEKGLAKELVDEVLSEHYAEEVEEEIAAALAQERILYYQRIGASAEKSLEKTKQFLIQRGFPWSMTKTATAELLPAADRGDEDDAV